jgi:hypothetical protein
MPADQYDQRIQQAVGDQGVRDTFMRVQTTLRDAENAVKSAADDARKASAYASLWLVVSLLVGAFVAHPASARARVAAMSS